MLFITGMYGKFQKSYLEKINYKGNVTLLSEEPLWDILLTQDKRIITNKESLYNSNEKYFSY